jgi:hypothetical protein
MRFVVEVGNAEKTKIEFSRNWYTGTMSTIANGVQVAQQDALDPSTHFSFKTLRRYVFTVGELEKHHVVIEKERPLLLAGLRPQTYRIFVDGVLCHQQRGY